MEVIALETGFFGGRRIRANQKFDVPDGTKGRWFVPVDGASAPGARGKAKKAPETLSQIAKAPVSPPGEADNLV